VIPVAATEVIYAVNPDGTLRAVIIGTTRNEVHARLGDAASLVADTVTPATAIPLAASRAMSKKLVIPVVLTSVALAGLAVVEALRRKWGGEGDLAFWRRS
jgi:hypothetical protein